ncbi:MAG: metallophosphoesterase [Candidatus Krumholzibacteriales bacterium]
MSGKNKVVIVSDIHMADPDFPASQKSRFIGFLNEFVKEEAAELILLGDIFELSQRRMAIVYEECLDVLMKLLEVANCGTEITYLLGNHDFTISDVRGFNLIPHPNITVRLARDRYLPVRKYVGKGGEDTRKAGAEKIPTSACFRTLQGKRVFLAHGHEFNHYFRGNPQRFDSVIRAAGILEEISPTLDDRLLGSVDRLRSGIYNLLYSSNTPGRVGMAPDELEFLLAARDICKFSVTEEGELKEREESDRIDYVFFGHTHVQQGPVELRDEILGNSGKVWGTYYNTGTWVIMKKRADYTVIEPDGSVNSLQWE